MEYEKITPTISTCALKIYDTRKEINESYSSDWHMHPEHEIIRLVSGEKYFYVGGEEIALSPGDIIFVDSNVPHKTVTPVGSSSVLLQFHVTSSETASRQFELNSILGKSKAPYTVFPAHSEINHRLSGCIEKIRQEYAGQEHYFDYFIRSYLLELIAILYRNQVLTDYHEFLERIPQFMPLLRYIDSHYPEHISLEQACGILNFHKSYFCKKFRDTMGVSFVEYLNLVRLSKAKTLMQTTAKSIGEIAFEVGFSSVSYFIKTFKAHNGCSPNQYRALLPDRRGYY
jgi:AraC-like DNA-binding protein/mannose-6-phosphate isomerase-like protein (cupin superfamily)